MSSRDRGATPKIGVPKLLTSAVVPVGVTLALLVALTLIALLAMRREFASMPHFVSTMWLAINQAPLSADGVTLSVLPLVPTLLYGFAVAWQARITAMPYALEAEESVPTAMPGVPTDQMEAAHRAAALTTVVMVLAPVVVTGLAATVLDTASTDFPARVDGVGMALLWTVVVNLVSVTVGLWWAHVRWLRKQVPHYVVAGLHMGGAFVAATWVIAGIVGIVFFIINWSDLGLLFGTAEGDAWGLVALFLLSVGYAPNVFALGSAAVVGGQANIGDASASVFTVAPGDLPALPILAAWPASQPSWWWQLALVAAALSAVLIARYSARWFAATRDGVLACLVAAATAIVVSVLARFLVGGEVGLLGSAGYPLGLTCLLIVAWMGVLGSATMALSLVGVERKRTAAADRIRQRRERVAAKNAAHGGPGTAAGAAAGAGTTGVAAAGAASGSEEITPTHDGGAADSQDTASATAQDEAASGANESGSTATGAANAEPAADGSGDATSAESHSASEAAGEDSAPAASEGQRNPSPPVVEKKVFGTEDSERDITDEFPVITEQMLAEAEAADGWTGDDAAAANGADTGADTHADTGADDRADDSANDTADAGARASGAVGADEASGTGAESGSEAGTGEGSDGEPDEGERLD